MSLGYREQGELIKMAEAAILKAIAKPVRTKDLVHALMPVVADEYSIKAANWFLIDRGELEIRRETGQVLLARVTG
jgi:hypothetical protein